MLAGIARGAGARFLICALLLLPAPLAARSGEWTATDPPIDWGHISHGRINARGEAVGYHYRPGGVDPPDARVVHIFAPPDRNGVYEAAVELRDPASGHWVEKLEPSSFFPDAMRDPEVIRAILTAFRAGHLRADGRFIGPSGSGFRVEGWYERGHIEAAYPLRRR